MTFPKKIYFTFISKSINILFSIQLLNLNQNLCTRDLKRFFFFHEGEVK